MTVLESNAVQRPVESPDFGLSARALGLLRELFAAQPLLQKAVVYGSRAKGNFRPGSDIDIALDGPTLTFYELMRIETAIDELMLPWTIDLCLLSHIDNPGLLEHIARFGKPLWTRKSESC